MDIDITDLPTAYQRGGLTAWDVPGCGLYQVHYDGLIHRYTVERMTTSGWTRLIDLYSPEVVSARGALQLWLGIQPCRKRSLGYPKGRITRSDSGINTSAQTFTQEGQLSADLSDDEMVQRLSALSYEIHNLRNEGQLGELYMQVRAGSIVLPGRNQEESEVLLLDTQHEVFACVQAIRRNRRSKWWWLALALGAVVLGALALPHLAGVVQPLVP